MAWKGSQRLMAKKQKSTEVVRQGEAGPGGTGRGAARHGKGTNGPKKNHLSASQLEQFAKCPEQWRRRYLDGDRRPPGIALLKGKAVHAAAEQNFSQKIASHTDLATDDIVELAVESMRGNARAGYELSPEEQAVGKRKVIRNALDSVAATALVHATEQAPDYQPIAVERSFEIELPGNRNVTGVIDLVDDLDRVVDLKTGRRRHSQQEADDSLQLTIYSGAFLGEMGRFPSLVQLDCLIESDSGTKRSVMMSSRGPEDLTALARRIDVVSATIDAGLFPPAPPGSWWCSAKWCGFHATCPFVNGSRKQGD